MSSIFSSLTLASSPVQPTVTSQPVVIPYGMKRATWTDEMFDIIIDTSTVDYVYNIGSPGTPPAHKVRVRNLCVENTLGFALTFPNFLSITPFGLILQNTGEVTQQSYIIPVGYTLDLQIIFNEQYAIVKSPYAQKQYFSSISYTVTPLNVTGPVLVQKLVPQLTF